MPTIEHIVTVKRACNLPFSTALLHAAIEAGLSVDQRVEGGAITTLTMKKTVPNDAPIDLVDVAMNDAIDNFLTWWEARPFGQEASC